MVTAFLYLVTIAALTLPSPQVAQNCDEWRGPTHAIVLRGDATYYAPLVMETVAVNRGLIEHTNEYTSLLDTLGVEGGVALNRAGDLGRQVWLDGPLGTEGPYLVMDCAQ